MQVDSATTTSAILAALKQWPELDTSNWSCRCALTLALKPKLCSGGYLFSLDEMQAKENFRVFMKSLNRACYGRAVRRHGLRLRVIPVIESEADGRLHFHAAIEPPPHLSPAEFEWIVRKCWFETEWADCRYDGVKIKFRAEPYWVHSYILKRWKSG